MPYVHSPEKSNAKARLLQDLRYRISDLEFFCKDDVQPLMELLYYTAEGDSQGHTERWLRCCRTAMEEHAAAAAVLLAEAKTLLGSLSETEFVPDDDGE
jgi:hypothetical protein